MSTWFQGRSLSTISGGDNPSGAENSKELLRTCLKSIHEVTRRYYYLILAEESVPGSLSYLLGMSEEDLVEIFKICGFYNNNKSSGLLPSVFQDWVVASFDSGTVEFTTFKKRTLIKIGIGVSPERPSIQLKEGLE